MVQKSENSKVQTDRDNMNKWEAKALSRVYKKYVSAAM